MADREFKIKITGDASGFVASSQQSADALRNTAHEVEESGRKTETHAKHVELFNLRTGEQRKLLRELGEQFPVAATAARLFMDPLVASITIGIGLFSAMKEKLDDVNKALDEQAAKLADPSFLEGTRAKHDAIIALRKELADYNEELQKTVDAEKDYNQNIDKQTQLLNAELAVQEKLNAARRDTQLAEIDLAEKSGKINPAQAAIARLAIGQEGRTEGVNVQAAEHGNELNAIRAKLLEMEKLAPAAQKKVEAAEKKAEQSAGDAAKNQSFLSTLQKNQPDLDKQAKEARERAESLGRTYDLQHGASPNGFGEWLTAHFSMVLGQSKVKEAVDEAAQKQGIADQNSSSASSIRGQLEAGNSDQAALNEAKAANKELTDTFRALVQELNIKAQLYGIQDTGASAVAGQQNKAAIDRAAGALADSPKAMENLLKIIDGSHRLTLSVVSGSQQNIESLNGLVQQLANSVAAMARQIQQTKSQIQTNRGQNSGG